MKLLLIVNPASGKRRQRKLVPLVQAWFARHGHQLETVYTKHGGHAEELAVSAVRNGGYDAVIGAGGDGTINEVINGLAGSTVPLGILPWGTTNVFSLEMGFPRSLVAQCRVIHRRLTRTFDLGRANGRAFLMMAGVGFDAYALHHMKGLKSSLGPLSYIIAGFRSLVRYRLPRFRVHWGSRTHEASFVAISNTTRYGGLFSFTPKANPSDGHLDVYLYRERGRFRMIKLAASLFLSHLQPSARIRRRFLYLREANIRTKELRIESDAPAWFQLDGDVRGRLPLTLSCQEDAVQVIVPRKAFRVFSS